MTRRHLLTLVSVVSAFLPLTVLSQSLYQLGVGIADVTGPAAEIGMVSMTVKESTSSCTNVIQMINDNNSIEDGIRETGTGYIWYTLSPVLSSICDGR